MVIELGEYEFPDSVDRKQVEELTKNVIGPACEKAGFKMFRFGWLQNEEGTNIGIFIGEMDSLENLEKYWASKGHQELEEELGRLYPDLEAKRRLVDVVE